MLEAMASLSTAGFFAKATCVKQERAATMLWQRRERDLAFHTGEASLVGGEMALKGFISLTQAPPAQQRGLLLLCTAKRSSGKRGSLIEEPLPTNEDEGNDDDEEYVRPVLPGDETDFWEGPQWDLLGFVVEYLWAIGIVVALTGCFVAVRYYNYGATADFKDTEVYKEAMKFQGEPSDSKVFQEESDSKVFEEPPPLQDAPSVTTRETSS